MSNFDAKRALELAETLAECDEDAEPALLATCRAASEQLRAAILQIEELESKLERDDKR